MKGGLIGVIRIGADHNLLKSMDSYAGSSLRAAAVIQDRLFFGPILASKVQADIRQARQC